MEVMETKGRRARRAVAWLPCVLLLAAGCESVPERAPAGDESVGPKAAMSATNADLHQRLATRAMERGLFAEASRNAREALRVDPTRADAALVLSRALLHSGQLDEAEAAASLALELRRDSADALLVRGDCAAEAGRDREARRWYEEAADLGSADGAFLLGVSLLRSGQHEAGEHWLRKAAQQASESEPLVVLASHYWDQGRLDDAKRALTEAIALSPDRRELSFKLDQLQVAMAARGGPPAPVSGDSVEQRLLSAAGLLKAGEAARAADLYRALGDSLPEDPTVRIALGEALLSQGDLIGAESAFRAALRLEESRAALVGVGRSLMRAGRSDEAARSLREATRVDPDHVPTRSLLVRAWIESGNVAMAEQEASEVSVRAPGSDLDLACRKLLASVAVGGDGVGSR